MIQYTCRKQLLVVPFANLQTAQRPEMPKMKAREDPPVAKIGIRKNLREEPVHQGFQIES
jgi:hypothetical protein